MRRAQCRRELLPGEVACALDDQLGESVSRSLTCMTGSRAASRSASARRNTRGAAGKCAAARPAARHRRRRPSAMRCSRSAREAVRAVGRRSSAARIDQLIEQQRVHRRSAGQKATDGAELDQPIAAPAAARAAAAQNRPSARRSPRARAAGARTAGSWGMRRGAPRASAGSSPHAPAPASSSRCTVRARR